MTNEEKVFNSYNLPAEGWELYKKVVPTQMIKIEGPFTVQTSEGPLHCEDGFLAKDARGYGYPIATDEQALIYVKVDEEN